MSNHLEDEPFQDELFIASDSPKWTFQITFQTYCQNISFVWELICESQFQVSLKFNNFSSDKILEDPRETGRWPKDNASETDLQAKEKSKVEGWGTRRAPLCEHTHV